MFLLNRHIIIDSFIIPTRSSKSGKQGTSSHLDIAMSVDFGNSLF